MSKFLFTYHGGSKPESDAQMAEVMQAWQSWFVSMGDDVINGGNPVGMSIQSIATAAQKTMAGLIRSAATV